MAEIDFSSRVGIWWPSDRWPINDVISRAREIEQLGYASLFYGEAGGKEAFTQAAALLGGTDRLVLGTGIANIHARSALASEAGARTLGALYPGRFVLGLGVSHAPLVEHSYAGSYSKPLSTMREYLATMDAVPPEVEAGAQRPARLPSTTPTHFSMPCVTWCTPGLLPKVSPTTCSARSRFPRR